MKKLGLYLTGLFSCGVLLGAVVLFQAGCQSQGASDFNASTAPGMVAQGEGGSARGGAEIWASTCIRCHNNRSPTSYSDAHWDVAMLHMRIQANLTAEDARAISDFLKASN